MNVMTSPRDGWDHDERETIEELGPELEALRQRHLGDPPVDLLCAARANVLPEPLQDEAARYLTEHEWGRTLVDDLTNAEVSLSEQDQARLLRRIREVAHDATPRRRFTEWFRQPAFAVAALAIIVVAARLVWQTNPPPPAKPSRPETTAPKAAPQAPTFKLPLEKPPVKLGVAALTWRGAGRENPLIAELKPGLDAFRANDYAKADQELARVIERFPTAIEPPFYQGVSRLFLNDASGAVQSLSTANRLADPSFAPDVLWYLSVAEERAGRIADARAHLSALCGTASNRSAEACAGVSQLK